MKKDKLINLRVSESKHAEYVKVAESKGMTLSKLVRELLERELINSGSNKNKYKQCRK